MADEFRREVRRVFRTEGEREDLWRRKVLDYEGHDDDSPEREPRYFDALCDETDQERARDARPPSHTGGRRRDVLESFSIDLPSDTLARSLQDTEEPCLPAPSASCRPKTAKMAPRKLKKHQLPRSPDSPRRRRSPSPQFLDLTEDLGADLSPRESSFDSMDASRNPSRSSMLSFEGWRNSLMGYDESHGRAQRSSLHSGLGRGARMTHSSLRARHGASSVLVVAIDFGTTYSGYAFSFLSDFQRNPLQVKCMNLLSGGAGHRSQSAKVPTCLLFTPQGKMAAFGQEAEDQFARLCVRDRKKAKQFYFFHRFKMELHNKTTLSRTLLLKDTSGKTMRALDVFSAAIRYLKTDATKSLADQDTYVEESDVTWVLTVPAIWDNSARQFMREAAIQAGIQDENLVLALEPEAASVYCLEYFRSHDLLPKRTSITDPGRKFMTVDCGGGTVDISVFEVGRGRQLEQLHRPEGAPCGGVKVDAAFKKFLLELLGVDATTAIDELELVQILREFEVCKRSIGSSDRVAINIPSTLRMAFAESLRQSIHAGTVKLTLNKLTMPSTLAEGFFKESIDGITSTMRRILSNPAVGRVDAILLVGGFSGSEIIQRAVSRAFPNDHVLTPSSPDATVVMGAVMYGHRPKVISRRVAAFSYGISSHTMFIDGVHDYAKLTIEDDVVTCRDVFNVFIRADQPVDVDEETPYQSISPLRRGQKAMSVNIYRSVDPFPMYVTEPGCERIGRFSVKMPDQTGGKQRNVQVAMSASGTELQVSARDENTGRLFSTTCDFLCKP